MIFNMGEGRPTAQKVRIGQSIWGLRDIVWFRSEGPWISALYTGDVIDNMENGGVVRI